MYQLVRAPPPHPAATPSETKELWDYIYFLIGVCLGVAMFIGLLYGLYVSIKAI
jgi:hypothetical protein